MAKRKMIHDTFLKWTGRYSRHRLGQTRSLVRGRDKQQKKRKIANLSERTAWRAKTINHDNKTAVLDEAKRIFEIQHAFKYCKTKPQTMLTPD
jgi:hypothetical protein